MSNERSKKIKVCLLGASFETSNMGVSALAEASIKCIFIRWPDAEITLLDSGRKNGEYRIGVLGQEMRVSSLPIRFSKNVSSPNHFVVLTLYALFFKMFPLRWLRKKLGRKNKCLKRILEADLVVDITAGDSFSDIYGVRRFVIGSLRKWLVIQFGKKLIMLPQTYGPFKRSMVKAMAKYILKRSSLVYCRDRAGVAYVRNILGNHDISERVRFGPDVGFVLDQRAPHHINVDSLEEARTDDSVVVGLNISGLLFNGGSTQNNMFGLKDNYRDLVCNVIELLMRSTKTLVLLVPHVFCVGHIESDTDACLQVYKTLNEKFKGRLFLTQGQYDQNEIKYIIGLCNLLIGSRMHACIGALSQCIPAVGLAYSAKFYGVFESIGMGRFVADMRHKNQKEILTIIASAFEQRKNITEHLKKVIPKTKKQVMNIFGDIPWH